jgi:hypothetical protein
MSKEIRTREKTKDIKVFDRAAVAGKHMKDAAVRTAKAAVKVTINTVRAIIAAARALI